MTSDRYPPLAVAETKKGGPSARQGSAIPRFFLSATHKSSGKTTIAIGLVAAFAARGARVRSFKKGPDYIDPMWHARVSGQPCFNLDFNTQDTHEIIATFARHARGAELALVEGNNGLHDGVDLEGRDSSAALAKLLKCPVVLVVDTSGVMRGIAPLVLGYAAFDPAVKIAGLILNKVGNARQETKLRQAIERYTDIPVIGAIGRDPALALQERHLGLATPAESPGVEQAIAAIRRTVASSLDLDRLLELAGGAPDLPTFSAPAGTSAAPDVRIAVARDSAFGFYYPDDLEALERAGARLCFFDALADTRLPPADGLFIGGGFPETHADRLQANCELRGAVRDAVRDGLPVYAECGGLMYLTRSIIWRGNRSEMVGVIPADAVMYDKPQGHGLVALEETAHAPWPDVDGTARRAPIPGHEFHYARLENLDPALRFAYRMRRGVGIGGGHDGIVLGNMLASFSHQRATVCNNWASRFVAFVRRHKEVRAWCPGSAVDDAPAERSAARLGSIVGA
jgi:cobyrinic acid a,c-diamide synthase